MIYSRESVAGLSLYEAVMQLTDRRDPRDYGGSIILSDHKKISITRKNTAEENEANKCRLEQEEREAKRNEAWRRDRNYVGLVSRVPVGITISYPGRDEKKRQLERAQNVAEAYAEMIRPLFDDLAANKLAVLSVIQEKGSQAKQPEPLPNYNWTDPWQLGLRENLCRLYLGSYSNPTIFRLFEIRLNEVNASPSSATLAKPVNGRRARGPSTDDEPYHSMMEIIIRDGVAKSPWDAAKILVNSNKCVPLAGAQPDSVIKRLSAGYKKTNRPRAKVEVQKNAPITQI